MTSILILDKHKVEQKILRLAWQIYEKHAAEKSIILFGIKNRGFQLAELLAQKLQAISDLEVEVGSIRMNKRNPVHDEITLSHEPEYWKSRPIVIVDDVTNSGQTLMYALKPFMGELLSQLHIAVLVDRAHKKFPISPDFVGLSLSTTLQEHITLNMDEGQVYLS